MSDRDKLVEAMARWVWAEIQAERREFRELIWAIATAKVPPPDALDIESDRRSTSRRRSAP
jgi:hypothetical protein